MKNIRKIIIVGLCFLCIYLGYEMKTVNFDFNIIFPKTGQVNEITYKYHGMFSRFDTEKYVEENRLFVSYERNIDTAPKTTEDVARVYLSEEGSSNILGYIIDMYYNKKEKNWVVYPIYPDNMEFIIEPINVWVITDNKIIRYSDGMK